MLTLPESYVRTFSAMSENMVEKQNSAKHLFNPKKKKISGKRACFTVVKKKYES